jgi:hypothetical protein
LIDDVSSERTAVERSSKSKVKKLPLKQKSVEEAGK